MEKSQWLFEYKGTVFLGCSPTENLDAMPDFKIRDGDVIVVGYPKAGSHWCGEMVNKVLRAAGKTSEATEDREAPGRILEFTDELGKEMRVNHRFMEDRPSPRLITTHLPREFAPRGVASPQGNTKVIHVMRNPKDTVLSYYHFMVKLGRYANCWEMFAEDVLQGRWGYGDFYPHALGWWQMRDNPHFLFLKYEDMKRDTKEAVKKIVTFLGADIEEDQVKSIAEACSFQNIQGNYSKRSDYKKVIARKGIVGDWKSVFTEELSAMYDAKYDEKLEGTGLKFDFE